MSFTIRSMVASDLSAIEHIQTDAYTGYFLESAEVIAQRFNLSPATAWVAERDQEVCAYLVGYWSMLGKINPLNAPFALVETANCLYLHDLALLKSAQGFGVGKQLIRTATEYALKNSVAAMALLSVQDSKRFWQGFGFSEFTVLDKHQQANLQTYITDNESAYYMTRML